VSEHHGDTGVGGGGGGEGMEAQGEDCWRVSVTTHPSPKTPHVAQYPGILVPYPGILRMVVACASLSVPVTLSWLTRTVFRLLQGTGSTLQSPS
jgi:hypothetical protein